MEKQKIANFEIKKMNRNAIYQVLLKNGDMTKQEIIAKTQLSLPTVTQNIEFLCNEQLVEVSGAIGNTGGRKARSYGAIKKARYAIGIDITKGRMSVVLLDLSGTVTHSKAAFIPFEATDEYYCALGNLVAQIVKESKCDESKILGVGIGVPALLSEDHQVMTNGEKLGCTGLTCSELAKYIPYPSKFFNDSDSAAFSEYWGRDDLGDVFYLMLSGSVGGAYIFGSSKHETADSLRHSEVGHITLHPGGKVCYCGKKGCSNAYLMAPVLSSMTDNSLSLFFSKLREGDPEVSKTWDTYLSNLSYVVSNIRVTLRCNVIIGGYVGAYMDEYIDKLRELTLQRNFFETDGSYIMPSRFKEEPIAAGAALPYVDEYIKSI